MRSSDFPLCVICMYYQLYWSYLTLPFTVLMWKGFLVLLCRFALREAFMQFLYFFYPVYVQFSLCVHWHYICLAFWRNKNRWTTLITAGLRHYFITETEIKKVHHTCVVITLRKDFWEIDTCLKHRNRTSSPNVNSMSPRRDISSVRIRLISSILKYRNTSKYTWIHFKCHEIKTNELMLTSQSTTNGINVMNAYVMTTDI